MNIFHDKVIIVTGASEGIGRALCLALAPQKPKLVLAARNENRLEKLKEEVESEGAKSIVVPADVSEEKACKSLIEKTISEFDQLDVLVNNAGRTMWTTLENMVDISIIEQLMRINYFSAAYCTSYESQKPSIEFVGSKLCRHIYYVVMIPLVITKIVVD